jgi:hypothetical protein
MEGVPPLGGGHRAMIRFILISAGLLALSVPPTIGGLAYWLLLYQPFMP